MRVVIQRVTEASVSIRGALHSRIGQGVLILVGIEDRDGESDIELLTSKISNLRIFDDSEGVMNLSVKDINGEALVVSQFTLMGSTRKGNRPTYIKATLPEIAIPLYERFCNSLSAKLGKAVRQGVFGADMQVALVNDGPVTILIDTHNKE